MTIGWTDNEKNAVRVKVNADNERMMQALAPLYLGKYCPLAKEECHGPQCALFLPTGDANRITGGACSIPLFASQAGPIAAGLVQLAEASSRTSEHAPRVIPNGSALR